MELRSRVDADGFALIADVLPTDRCAAVAASLPPAGTRRAGGVRNLLSHPAALAIARDPRLRVLVGAILGDDAVAVRALLFDKEPVANWRVPWHRDRHVAVARRIDAPGWRGWSVKAGVVHAEPPRAVLDGMLAARVHLDDAGAADGALRVIAGSHRDAVIDDEGVAQRTPIVCAGRAGSVLLMRPLLLHDSAAAQRPRHRRVLHLEFAAGPLPDGLEWAETA